MWWWRWVKEALSLLNLQPCLINWLFRYYQLLSVTKYGNCSCCQLPGDLTNWNVAMWNVPKIIRNRRSVSRTISVLLCCHIASLSRTSNQIGSLKKVLKDWTFQWNCIMLFSCWKYDILWNDIGLKMVFHNKLMKDNQETSPIYLNCSFCKV